MVRRARLHLRTPACHARWPRTVLAWINCRRRGEKHDDDAGRSRWVEASFFWVALRLTRTLAAGIQGAGAGVIFAIVEIILSDLVPLSERGLYQAGFSATWSFASATGPLIGGAFASFDYRWLFWINPIMSLPIALCCVWVMKLKGPEDDMREKLAKMDWCGALIHARL